MSAPFASALRSSFQGIFASFRSETLVFEVSLCLRLFSCPAVLCCCDKSWLVTLPELCLHLVDLLPGPVYSTLAECLTQLGPDVFGVISARSSVISRLSKLAAASVCSDDLEASAAAARFLCGFLLAVTDQSSPFTDSASAVLDIANFVKQNFVENTLVAADAKALGCFL